LHFSASLVKDLLGAWDLNPDLCRVEAALYQSLVIRTALSLRLSLGVTSQNIQGVRLDVRSLEYRESSLASHSAATLIRIRHRMRNEPLAQSRCNKDPFSVTCRVLRWKQLDWPVVVLMLRQWWPPGKLPLTAEF
jgi:hypothetical protein